MEAIGNREIASVAPARSDLTITRPIIGALLALALIDFVWCRATGLSVGGWVPAASGASLLLCVWLLYSRVRPAPMLAETAHFCALWVGFTALGCTLTYLGASTSHSFVDDAFASIDASVGFDWVAWTNFVRDHSVLNVVLQGAYRSLMPQIIGSVVLFSFAKASGRNAELLLTAMISLGITVVVSALLPALGPWVHFHYPAQSTADMAYVADVLALRTGTPTAFILGQMQGIVCFPSYHTVLAILLIYAHRGLRWWRLVMLLNGLMLLSIPPEGGHYIADMLGGAVVAFCAIWIQNFFARLLATGGLKPFHNRRHAF